MWPEGPNPYRTICFLYSRLKITSLNISVLFSTTNDSVSSKLTTVIGPPLFLYQMIYTIFYIFISGYSEISVPVEPFTLYIDKSLTSDMFAYWFCWNHQIWNSSGSERNIRFPLYITPLNSYHIICDIWYVVYDVSSHHIIRFVWTMSCDSCGTHLVGLDTLSLIPHLFSFIWAIFFTHTTFRQFYTRHLSFLFWFKLKEDKGKLKKLYFSMLEQTKE